MRAILSLATIAIYHLVYVVRNRGVDAGSAFWFLEDRIEKCLSDVNAVMEVKTQNYRQRNEDGDHSSGNSHKAAWQHCG